jgi:hypothetical protein
MSRWGRWYLSGAQAVVAYGVPRLSADVDVTVALVPDDPVAFVKDMDAAGFSLRVGDPDFVRRTRVLPFVHRATAMPLDVVLAGSGLEEAFLERARPTPTTWLSRKTAGIGTNSSTGSSWRWPAARTSTTRSPVDWPCCWGCV